MATSSITATFYCDDAKAANAFMRILAQPVGTGIRKKRVLPLEAIAKPRSRQARPSHNRVNLAFFGRDALVASANCRGFAIASLVNHATMDDENAFLTCFKAERSRSRREFFVCGIDNFAAIDQVLYDQMSRVIESVV